MALKLKYVKLFDGFFIPGGTGVMKDTLPASDKTMKELEMYLEDNGTISLYWKGLAGKKESFVLGVSMWKGAQPSEIQPPKAQE